MCYSIKSKRLVKMSGLLLTILILLSSCSASDTSGIPSSSFPSSTNISDFLAADPVSHFSFEQIALPPIDDDSLLSYYGISGTSFYFCDMKMSDDNDSTLPVYKYDLVSETLVEIGEIETFSISTGDYIILDETLYFYTTIQREDGLENMLYALDTKEDTIQLCTSYKDVDKNTGPFISLAARKNILISLKKEEPNDEFLGSYIEEYDPITKQTTMIMREELKNNSGKYIIAMAQLDEDIYLLEHTRNPDDQFSLSVYDSNWELKTSINVDELHEFLLTHPFRMYTMSNGYISLSDFNFNCVIAQIENDKLTLQKSGISALSTKDFNHPQSSSLYTQSGLIYMDSSTNELREIPLDLSEGVALRCVFADGENLLLEIRNQNGEIEWYTTTVQEFAQINIGAL